MTTAFSWQNSISLCPASFCIPRTNLPVTPGVSWLPTFAFQSPIVKRTSFLGVCPLLGIHTEETIVERDTCTPMFMAALFTIARTWKQPRCPSADEWIRKLWYIYTMEYYSAIKRNTFESVLMRWMKLEPIIQREVSQKEKHQYSIEQSFGFCGRGRGWDDLGEWHWNMYNVICKMNRQSRLDAWYRMLGAGAQRWPRGMVWGGRWEGGSRWGTRVYSWQIHVDVWQNHYNIVK